MAESKRTCLIDGCTAVVTARGWCNRHYRRWKKHGDPLSGNTHYSTPEEAFASRVERRGACLEWTGSKDALGYGRLRHEARPYQAHRFSWELSHGPIPEGLYVDHACHNPSCVRVEHLRLATPSQNLTNRAGARRGSASGIRNVRAFKGKWQVSMAKEGTRYYLGTYNTIEEAEEVATRERRRLFGEYAGLG